MEQFETILRSHDLRLTNARRTVFSVLEKTHEPLFIHQIIAACDKVDRTSVYRALELFTEHDIVTTVPIGWRMRYELSDTFKPHHHHLVCTVCHTSIEIQPLQLEKLVSSISTNHGFTATSHHFEIAGICQNCQNSIK